MIGRVAIAAILACTAAMAQSEVEQAPPTSTVVVPVVGTVIGANDVKWRTAVELHNDSRNELTVVLTMPTAPDANFVMLPMAPGAAIRMADVAAALGVENGLSPLVVTTNSRRSVTVYASAYGIKGTDAFTPQPIAVSYGSTYFPVRVLRELSFSSDYRTNIGLVNVVAGREVAPEFVQDALVPARVADVLSELLDVGSPRRIRMIEELDRVRAMLGEAGAADRVATMAIALARGHDEAARSAS